MATLPLIEWDSDLVPLLRSCNNDLLDPLVAYITNNNKGRISSKLDTLPIYQQQHPNHIAYVDEITAEIQKFGGNTIANIFRGGQGERKLVACAMRTRERWPPQRRAHSARYGGCFPSIECLQS